MPKHRRTHVRVANKPELDNFDPAEALESLHTEIVQIEAIAHAAGEAVTGLPHALDPQQRRAFARIYALVSKLADDVGTAVTHGDEMIAALALHLQHRRGGDELEASPATT
jgi:hypothetical protein